jgi:hypothetical protein
VAVQTNPTGAQWKQVDELIGRFAFSDRIKDEAKKRAGGRADFDRDVKPLLGNDLVAGFAGTSLRRTDAVVAFRPKDMAKMRAILARDDRKAGQSHGADVYEDVEDEDATAVDEDMVVAAPNRESLDAALARHDGSDHLTEDDFEQQLGRLNRDALFRATGNLQPLASKADAGAAPWLKTLRTFAAAGYAQPNGLAIDFDVRTEGATADQLPLAPGAASPPVPRRKGEVGVAVRDPGRSYRFLDALRQALPKGADHQRFQDAMKKIGIDFNKEVLEHLGDTAAISVGADKGFAARADLNDPAGVETALKEIAAKLPAALGPSSGFRMEPGGGDGFYRMTGRDGRQTFVGVVGDRIALGSEAGRAREFANADAEPVPGAHGGLAVYANAEEVADEIIGDRAGGLAGLFGQALTRPLGELTGWAEAKPSGITGHLQLEIDQ